MLRFCLSLVLCITVVTARAVKEPKPTCPDEHPDNKECKGSNNCIVLCKDGQANEKGLVNFKTFCTKDKKWPEDGICKPVVSK